MASGKVVAVITAIVGPASSQASANTIAGASSPAEVFPVWDFADGATSYLDCYGTMGPDYAGGGLTVRLPWASTATTGDARIGVAFRAFPDDAEDIDSTAFTYDYNLVTITAASAAGETVYDNVTFSDGSDMDSVGLGETFIMRIERVGGDAADTMSGTFRLLAHNIQIRET